MLAWSIACTSSVEIASICCLSWCEGSGFWCFRLVMPKSACQCFSRAKNVPPMTRSFSSDTPMSFWTLYCFVGYCLLTLHSIPVVVIPHNPCNEVAHQQSDIMPWNTIHYCLYGALDFLGASSALSLVHRHSQSDLHVSRVESFTERQR